MDKELKSKIDKVLRDNELVTKSMAVKVLNRPFEATPVWSLDDPEKSVIIQYDVQDEDGKKLFSIPVKKPMSKYELEYEISKKLTKSDLKTKADSQISYGPSIVTQPTNNTDRSYKAKSVKYQITKSNDGKFLARVKRQLVDRFDTEEGAKAFIDSYKYLIHDKLPSAKMTNYLNLGTDSEGKHIVHLTQDILKSFSSEEDALSFIDSYKQIIKEAKLQMKKLTNVQSIQKVDLSEFKDLESNVQKKIREESTDDAVEVNLTALNNDLDEKRITEEEYYKEIGTTKSYAESTPWFIPSVYYDNHKTDIDEQVDEIVERGLYTEQGKWVMEKKSDLETEALKYQSTIKDINVGDKVKTPKGKGKVTNVSMNIDDEVERIYVDLDSGESAEFEVEHKEEWNKIKKISSLEIEADSKFKAGDIIAYDNSFHLVINVGTDYYNLGDLLETPYNDSDVLISAVDKDAEKSDVEGAKEYLELHEEDPSLIDKGLEAFEIYKGKIWEESNLETKAGEELAIGDKVDIIDSYGTVWGKDVVITDLDEESVQVLNPKQSPKPEWYDRKYVKKSNLETESQEIEVIGPIEITSEQFDRLEGTLDELKDISPELVQLSDKGNIVGVVTDGERYIGIDPQGYNYPRYKTMIFDNGDDVVDAAQRGKWRRKYISEGKKESDLEIESQDIVTLDDFEVGNMYVLSKFPEKGVWEVTFTGPESIEVKNLQTDEEETLERSLFKDLRVVKVASKKAELETESQYGSAKREIDDILKDMDLSKRIHQGKVDITEILPFQEIGERYDLTEEDYDKLINYAQEKTDNIVEKVMKESNLETESSAYTDFVKTWFKAHPEAKPGDEVTMKELKEDWEKAKESKAMYKIYKFEDRPSLLLACDILKNAGVNFIDDETNNSIEVELLDEDDGNEIDASLKKNDLKFEASDSFEGDELSFVRDENFDKKEVKQSLKREASKDDIAYKNKLYAIASRGDIVNFTYIYRFANKDDLYKACKVLHGKMILYTLNEENDSIGVFDQPIGDLFTEAKLNFTEANDLVKKPLSRSAKKMMDSEFDTSKGCWTLEDMPDGTLAFVKRKPLTQRIQDVLNKNEVKAGIKIVAKQTIYDMGDRSIPITILGRDPDNKEKIIVDAGKDGKLSVSAKDIFPIG